MSYYLCVSLSLCLSFSLYHTHTHTHIDHIYTLPFITTIKIRPKLGCVPTGHVHSNNNNITLSSKYVLTHTHTQLSADNHGVYILLYIGSSTAAVVSQILTSHYYYVIILFYVPIIDMTLYDVYIYTHTHTQFCSIDITLRPLWPGVMDKVFAAVTRHIF
jgi:hypothetical protein